jgi:hypothetical protein
MSTSRWLLREKVKGGMKTGDKLGMQPPAEGCTTAQKKSRTTKMARENTSFSEIVGVLENTLIAEEGVDAGLSVLIEAWNTLDGDAREAVLAIINAMKRG